MNLKAQIKNHIYNASGWTTGRKIVVIESDDWGSIRTESRERLEALAGIFNVHKNPFNRFDCLETKQDIEVLFDCLLSFRDINGSPLKLTPNYITANPDFDKIRDSGYEQYFFEEFPSSYKRYYQTDAAYELVKEGCARGFFVPQFHGREHVQVQYWMRDLKQGRKETRDAFALHFFGFGKNELDNRGYLSSFNATSAQELEEVKHTVLQGLNLFEKLFGYRSRSVIAPQNTMHYDLLPFLKTQGVEVIQGARINKQNVLHPGDRRHVKRFNGRMNAFGQLDIVRNAVFEPSAGKIDWVDRCLNEMQVAFLWKKPAVICSHRYNFVSHLDTANRDRGVLQLRQLIQKAQAKWPSIEFMTTTELADVILQSRK